MGNWKVSSIRQPADQANTLARVARVLGITSSEAGCLAIAEWIRTQRADPNWQERLRAQVLEEMAELGDREAGERLRAKISGGAPSPPKDVDDDDWGDEGLKDLWKE